MTSGCLQMALAIPRSWLFDYHKNQTIPNYLKMILSFVHMISSLSQLSEIQAKYLYDFRLPTNGFSNTQILAIRQSQKPNYLKVILSFVQMISSLSQLSEIQAKYLYDFRFHTNDFSN